MACLGLLGCGAPTAPPDPVWHTAYGLPLTAQQQEEHASWLAAWAAGAPAEPAMKATVAEGWRYAAGDPAEGLRAGIAARPRLDSLVELPHRVLLPDTPMWYARMVDLGGAAWLYVNADDGAQVFQDGVQLEPAPGEFFRLRPAEEPAELTIRVLNNALRGGLRDVRTVVAPASVPDWMTARARRVALKRLLYDALHAGALNDEQRARMTAALAGAGEAALHAARTAIPPRVVAPHLPQALPPGDRDAGFAFTAWGDSQGGWATFQQLVNLMARGDDAFSIGLGDLVANGADPMQWLDFTLALQPLLHRQPVFPVAGNHDYDGFYNDLVPRHYLATTRADSAGPAYVSWHHAGAFFLALDPNGQFPLGFGADQLAWMEAEMASDAWRAADWRFILLHQPPFAQGWPGYEGDGFIRALVDTLAEDRKIDVVLSGHSHDYERLSRTYGGQQTHFFVLGGAGGGLEPPESSPQPAMDRVIKAHHVARFQVAPGHIEVTVRGLDGGVLDRVTLSR